MFISSELFNAATKADRNYRINGTACADNVAAMERINAMLPAGSDYKYGPLLPILILVSPPPLPFSSLPFLPPLP